MIRFNHILISGNIGSGKSTLAELLSNKLAFNLFQEPYIDNPYLRLMYQDMNKWSFHSQIFFLKEHLCQHLQLQSSNNSIKDCSIYESVEIFGRNLFLNGNISEIDWNTYYSFYEIVINSIKSPDLIIYLDCPIDKLFERIRKRNRDFEKDISLSYIEDLNKLYSEWISCTKTPVISVDVSNLDFLMNPEHLDLVINRISK